MNVGVGKDRGPSFIKVGWLVRYQPEGSGTLAEGSANWRDGTAC